MSGPGSGRARDGKSLGGFMARPMWMTHPFLSGSPLGASVSPFVKWGHAAHHSAQSFEEALFELVTCVLAWFW